MGILTHHLDRMCNIYNYIFRDPNLASITVVDLVPVFM